jgi:hypothetical protein
LAHPHRINPHERIIKTLPNVPLLDVEAIDFCLGSIETEYASGAPFIQMLMKTDGSIDFAL